MLAYKSKQGLVMRWGTLIAGAVLFIFGTYRLFVGFPYVETLPEQRPAFWQWIYQELLQFTIPMVDVVVTISPRLLITIGIGLLLLLFMAYLCFRNVRISDFLIDTESEMRKVAWPTIKEVIDSSIVVIIAMVALGFYLFVVDFGLSSIFDWLFF